MASHGLTIHRANTFAARLLGLLVRPRLKPGEGLHLAPCASVHTVGMRYAIDVAFLDRAGRVLKLVRQLKPYRAAGCWGAHAAVELAAGEAERLGIDEGSRLDTAGGQGSQQ